MGIVGLGNIGMVVARIALTFGMKVVAFTSKPADDLKALGIEKISSYEELFSLSDVLSLHCPLTDDTLHLVNAERLALMKPSSILINTGRGPLVNEQDLADALNEGRIMAAGIDVLCEKLGLEIDDVLVFGDGLNDFERLSDKFAFLEEVGFEVPYYKLSDIDKEEYKIGVKNAGMEYFK